VRWLVAQPGPDWSVHDVHVGWVEALRELGEQVYEFNLNDRLSFFDNAFLRIGDEPAAGEPERFRKALTSEQAIELAVSGLAGALWKIRPDVLLLVSGFFADHEMLDHARRAYGTRVVVLHTEEPYEVEREVVLAAHADLNLINDWLHIDRFREVAPTVFAPHAYRPSVHYRGAPSPALATDLAFVGTGFGSRRWFFEQLADGGHLDGLDVLLAGNWRGLPDDSPLRKFIGTNDPGHCLDNAQAAELYRSARCGINLYRREAEDDGITGGVAMGPREVEMAACGLFFLRDPRAEGDRVLSMLPSFDSPEEAGALLRWHLDRPEVTRALADAACAAVADRTFTASATQLLGLLGRQTAAT
jgi:spore maturation protein CgeB